MLPPCAKMLRGKPCKRFASTVVQQGCLGDTGAAVLRDMSAARLHRKEENLQGWPKAVLEVVQNSS